MKDYLKVRKHPEAYRQFIMAFLPSVVGKPEFRRRIMWAKNDHMLCTVSDEAYTLLVIENNYDRWMDIDAQKQPGYEHEDESMGNNDEDNEEYDGYGSRKRKRIWRSNVPPKYTSGGIKFMDGDSHDRDEAKGWNIEGITRFNQLHKKITRDRGRRGLFMKELLEELRDAEVEQTTKRAAVVVKPKIRAINELFGKAKNVDQSQGAIQEEVSDTDSEVEEEA